MRPSPSAGLSSRPWAYCVGPPRRTSSAPAKPASTTPAFGLGWLAASRRHAASEVSAEPPTMGAHCGHQQTRHPRRQVIHDVVESRCSPAEPAISGRSVTDHRVERVDAAIGQQSGHSAHRAPPQRRHRGVRGVLRDGFERGPRQARGVQRLGVATAQGRAAARAPRQRRPAPGGLPSRHPFAPGTCRRGRRTSPRRYTPWSTRHLADSPPARLPRRPPRAHRSRPPRAQRPAIRLSA